MEENMVNKIIIGVDFDATLVDSDYPKILGLRPHAKQSIKRLYDAGFFIQIHSCRSGAAENMMATFLYENGIPYHVINDHAPWVKDGYTDLSRKLFHHILIDDTSLNYVLGEPIDWLKITDSILIKFNCLESPDTH